MALITPKNFKVGDVVRFKSLLRVKECFDPIAPTLRFEILSITEYDYSVKCIKRDKE